MHKTTEFEEGTDDSFNFEFKSWWIAFDVTNRNKMMEYQKAAEKFSGVQNVKVLYVSGGKWGNAQRNAPIDNIPDGFCYFLDDDNIVHPSMAKRLKEAHAIENKKVYVFRQQMEEGRIKDIVIERQRIDQAQYIVHRSLLERQRFLQKHDADGFLIKRLWANYKEDFCFIHEPLCYYNRLRWNDEK